MTELNKRRIHRSSTATGNLVRLGTPKAVTLTVKPANEQPFPVVRSDATAPAPKRVGRNVKRNDSPVLAVSFPASYDEDEVNATLADYGMDSYTVSYDDTAKAFRAYRSDLQSIANVVTTDIRLNDDGVVISLDAAQHAIQRADTKDHLKLVSFEFDIKRFDADAISAWIAQNHVDSVQDSVENPSGGSVTVKRSDVAEGTDTRRIELEAGVVAVIARADVADLPVDFADYINEAAYGNWGWGHLDFASSLADETYCSVMEDAAYKIGSVMRTITMHSELPLESRKQLVSRSLQQYEEFVHAVIDALPRQVLLLVTRAAAPSKESNTMTTKTNGAAANQAADTTATITRADLDAAVQVAVAAALASAAPATVARTDDTTAAPAAAAPAVAAPVAVPAVAETLTRSDVTEVVNTAMTGALAGITEQLASLANTVIVRSDSGDQVTKGASKEKPVSVFRGAIMGRRAADPK